MSRIPASVCHGTSVTLAVFVFVFALYGSDGFAQDATGEGDEAIEEIVVTGSRIKRRDFSSPSPIATIDRDSLDFSGEPTLEESLNRMPQLMPDFGRTSNNPGDGTARINLRGLGAGRTLVLLNGRRLAPSGIGSAVDVNNLPQVIVDRVEIITGGASTVYGSDAIAGVVNFITRENYEGFGAEASYKTTEKGDSEVADLSAAFGHNFAGGRGNVTLVANLLDREPLFAGDRELTGTTWREDGQGGVIRWGSFSTPASVIFTPVDTGSGDIFYTFEPDGSPRPSINPDDRHDVAPVSYLQIPLSRLSGSLFANVEVSSGLEAYTELTQTRNESKLNLAEVPTAGLTISVNVDNPVLHPETQQLFADNFVSDPLQPDLASFSIGKRFSQVGPRIKEFVRDYTRLVLGLRGDVGRDWAFDAWTIVTDASEEETLINDVSRSRLGQGLLVDPATGQCFDPGGGCVPANIFGEGNLSAEAANFLRINGAQNVSERTQKFAGVVFTGPLIEHWAGAIDAALGFEWRSDDGRFHADDSLFTGDAIGFRGAASVDGSEDVWAVYGEAVVPLVQDAAWADFLRLEVGARYSDYAHAGGSWTYKIGGDWQPFDGLRFRSMHQRSVRAPNIAELFEEQFAEIASFVSAFSADPCSASEDPVGNGFTEKCIIQGLAESEVGVWEATLGYPTEYVQGGNPELEPEIAETWTVGFVLTLESLPNWNMTFDYFDLEVTETIGSIQPDLICFDPLNAENLFCDKIMRDATGNVARILQLTENRGVLRATGIDTTIQYQAELPESLAIAETFAQVELNAMWTHAIRSDMQENPVTTVFSCAGRFGYPCYDGEVFTGGQTFSRNRFTLNTNYLSGPFSSHLTWRWIQGSDNAAPLAAEVLGEPPPILAVESIGSRNYFDLGFAYGFGEHWLARLIVNNLTDESAPFMASAVDSNNTDTRLYDVFGRSYQVSIAARF